MIKLGSMKLNIKHTDTKIKQRDLDLAKVMSNVAELVHKDTGTAPSFDAELMKETMYIILIQNQMLKEKFDKQNQNEETEVESK